MTEEQETYIEDTEIERCEITHNPCGTDTVRLGRACLCNACQKWLKKSTEEQGKYIKLRVSQNEIIPGRFVNASITPQDWKDLEESVNHNSRAKWAIGDRVIDEEGCHGVIGIDWDDGDFSIIENNAAHPNPRISEE